MGQPTTGTDWGQWATGAVQGAASGALGQIVGMAFHGIQSKQAQDDARAMQGIKLEGMEQATQIQEQAQKEMWDYTNKENEVKHLDAAGLNPALAEVQGIGGGVTGAGAPNVEMQHNDVAAREAVGQQIAMGISQQQLIDAQTRNLDAQTEEITGHKNPNTDADTENIKSRTQGQDFINKVNDAVGVKLDAEARKANDEMAFRNNQKAAIEYDAWLNAALDNKTLEGDDPNSPLAKMYKANIAQVFQNLENAKSQNDLTKALATVEGFKADLAKNGIPPDSPWYAKLLGDLLDKLGWNPMKAAVKVISQ